MARLTATLRRPDTRGPFEAYYRGAVQVMEQAALIATDRGRRKALTRLRGEMQAAGLGRLGNAIGSTSDLERGIGVHRRGDGGFSASGTLFIRSGSKRSRGAIEAYTQGAEIVPRRGRWLWIATDEIPRVTNRERMTPELYRKNGFETKIGPLVQIRGINGYPLLVVRNVGVSEAGRRRSARSLTKSGRPRKGQRARELIVAFVAIPRTTRAARVDPHAILEQTARELPEMWRQAMNGLRGGR